MPRPSGWRSRRSTPTVTKPLSDRQVHSRLLRPSHRQRGSRPSSTSPSPCPTCVRPSPQVTITPGSLDRMAPSWRLAASRLRPDSRSVPLATEPDRFPPGEALPALDGDLDVARLDLDGVAAPAELLRCDDRRA